MTKSPVDSVPISHSQACGGNMATGQRFKEEPFAFLAPVFQLEQSVLVAEAHLQDTRSVPGRDVSI